VSQALIGKSILILAPINKKNPFGEILGSSSFDTLVHSVEILFDKHERPKLLNMEIELRDVLEQYWYSFYKKDTKVDIIVFV
jgi:hypothetical protein